MGFGLLEELQRLGYKPTKKCRTTVLSRPVMVTTSEFAEISGLKRDHVQSLCAKGMLPSVRVGSDRRYKVLVDWERGLEVLREYADHRVVLPHTVDSNPVTVSDIRRLKRKTRKNSRSGSEYRKLPDGVAEKKRALKE